MKSDPADWLVRLVADKWELAVESVRAGGTTFPKEIRPTVAKSADRHRASVSLSNGVIIRIREGGDTTFTPASWGMTDRDIKSPWLIIVENESKGNAARDAAHACVLILDRLLELHRKEPNSDWQLIERWTKRTLEDFWDYQKTQFTIHLARYGEIMPTAIREPT